MKNKLLPFLLLLFCSFNAVSGCGRDKTSKKDVSLNPDSLMKKAK